MRENTIYKFLFPENIKWDEDCTMDMKASQSKYDAWSLSNNSANHNSDIGSGVAVTEESIIKDSELILLLNTIMEDAINDNANNIQIESVNGKYGFVRFAHGQEWTNYRLIQQSSVRPLITLIKKRAKLDFRLDNDNKQQRGGRIELKRGDEKVIFRTFAGWNYEGAFANLRILNTRIIDWEDLGFPEPIKKRLSKSVLQRNTKMLIVGGATGSGKSTTLNAILSWLVSNSNGALNIVSIESPIEVPIVGVEQLEVDESQGITYTSILENMLRVQPNIMRINEINTKSAAKAALMVANIGVTSMATLHINSAIDVFQTLQNYGIDDDSIKNSLGEVLYMLRPPKLCQKCKLEKLLTKPELDWIQRVLTNGSPFGQGSVSERNEEGCPVCRNVTNDKGLYGYNGNIAIFEYLEVNQPMLRIWRKYKHLDNFILKSKLLHPESVSLDADVLNTEEEKDALTGIIYYNKEADILDKLKKGQIDFDTAQRLASQ